MAGSAVDDLICSKMVTIGTPGVVEGNIQAESIIVAGRVKGSLVAKQKIHLETTAELEGDLSANKLSIQEGARVRGHAATDDARVPSSRPTITLPPDTDDVNLVPRNRPMAPVS